MYKLLVLYPEPKDRRAFQDYYEAAHLPLAAKMPGIVAWNYSLDLKSTEGEPAYFCVYEAEFDNIESFGLAMSSPEGKAVQEDVPNYATGGAIVLHFEGRR